MNKKELTGKDLLLCFLYSPGITDNYNEPIVGRTKLTKMMYLFEKEIYNNFFKEEINVKLPEFEAYYFGPFSRELFEDLAFFQSIGMVVSEVTSIPISAADAVESIEVFDDGLDSDWNEASFDDDNEKYELSYSLSNSGIKYVRERLWGVFTNSQKDKLKIFKMQINKISLDALLKYVYNKYPEDAKKSLIAKKYLDEDDK